MMQWVSKLYEVKKRRYTSLSPGLGGWLASFAGLLFLYTRVPSEMLLLQL